MADDIAIIQVKTAEIAPVDHPINIGPIGHGFQQRNTVTGIGNNLFILAQEGIRLLLLGHIDHNAAQFRASVFSFH